MLSSWINDQFYKVRGDDNHETNPWVKFRGPKIQTQINNYDGSTKLVDTSWLLFALCKRKFVQGTQWFTWAE